jgi:hypothetical protein
MQTWARTAVATLALATVVAGCGRGDGTEEVAVVRDLDLMEGVEAAGSARMAFHWDTSMEMMGGEDGLTTRITSEGEGVIGFATGEGTWSGSYVVEATPPEGSVDEYARTPTMNVESIQIEDGSSWSRLWVDGEDVPSWTEDPSLDDEDVEEEEEGNSLLGGPGFDPTSFLGRLEEEAASVTVVGTDEVRGDATTRYRAEIDADVLELGGEEGETTADVWIDGEDRLRRIEAEGMELELWDFGVPVDATAPTDVSAAADVAFAGDGLPEVTGDWEAAATGTTGGAAWTVFAAPGEMLGSATTCRTLELDGSPAEDPGTDAWADFPYPMHGTALATCGNGLAAMATSGFVPEPTLQVLSTPAGLAAGVSGGPALVGFVVAPEHAADGITLVLDGSEPVVLEPDASGVAVWDGAGSGPVSAVELDGGAVRCTFGFADEEEDGGGLAPGDESSWFGLIPPVCVEA